MGQIANRQSSANAANSRSIPQFHVERTLHQWTPIARFESQRNERKAYEDQIVCFEREIWPPTNASDSNRNNSSR